MVEGEIVMNYIIYYENNITTNYLGDILVGGGK